MLIPLFAILTDVPLLAHPGPIITVAVLGNLGLAAVGTLLSAVANTGRQSSYLLPLLVLPAVIPLVLGAAEATAPGGRARFRAGLVAMGAVAGGLRDHFHYRRHRAFRIRRGGVNR